LAESSEILVVAYSARSLAAAARRSGYTVVALDLFGDADLKSVAGANCVVDGDPFEGFNPGALLEAAAELSPPSSHRPLGLAYGVGFEAQAALLEQLSRGRRLYGNAPNVLARVKDPVQFFGALGRLGIPHPQTRSTAPEDGEGWLVKRIGGSGGTHVRPYAGIAAGAGCYYQRIAPGRPAGVSFLADGKRSLIIGVNEQWPASGDTAQPFRFSGACQPAVIGDRLSRDIQSLLDAVTGEFGLVGLNNLDVMDNGDTYAVLEVNPRPGANLDVFDFDGVGLFRHHLAACDGRLPQSWTGRPMATAMAVVYAANPVRVPAAVDWPEWVADRPTGGSLIEEGSPLCTVLAAGVTAGSARRQATERMAQILAALQAEEHQPRARNAREAAVASAAHA
jgi:predicted ATP-grasp superfamily ATP-dependent carboligase